MQTIKGIRVTDNQAEVYNVLREFGPLPDVALVPLAQHVMNSRQSSSGIRSRRAELEDAGLVQFTGRKLLLPSHRAARVFAVVK